MNELQISHREMRLAETVSRQLTSSLARRKLNRVTDTLEPETNLDSVEEVSQRKVINRCKSARLGKHLLDLGVRALLSHEMQESLREPGGRGSGIHHLQIHIDKDELRRIQPIATTHAGVSQVVEQ